MTGIPPQTRHRRLNSTIQEPARFTGTGRARSRPTVRSTEETARPGHLCTVANTRRRGTRNAVGPGLKVFGGQGRDSDPGPTHDLSRGAFLSVTPGDISAEPSNVRVQVHGKPEPGIVGNNPCSECLPVQLGPPLSQDLWSTQPCLRGRAHVPECLWSHWVFISSD